MAEAVVFIALALLLQIPALRRHVIPAAVARRRAGLLARAQFLAQGLHRTRERTGVLLFVAVEERYVEIIADEGINARVPPGAWQSIVDAFVAKVRAGDVAGGFVGAVTACGELLAEHFPCEPDDVDELPDRLVELD
jgi:putative membrane protein